MGRIERGGGDGGEPAESPPEGRCGFRIDLRRPTRSVGADQIIRSGQNVDRSGDRGVTVGVELQAMPLARDEASLDLSRAVLR